MAHETFVDLPKMVFFLFHHVSLPESTISGNVEFAPNYGHLLQE